MDKIHIKTEIPKNLSVSEYTDKLCVSPLPQRKNSRRIKHSSSYPDVDCDDDILVCRLVEASGIPNFMGCKITLTTRLHLEMWEQLLSEYQDKAVVQFLKYGFPISFHGELDPQNSKSTQNNRGATDHPDHIEQFLAEELQWGLLWDLLTILPLIRPVIFHH